MTTRSKVRPDLQLGDRVAFTHVMDKFKTGSGHHWAVREYAGEGFLVGWRTKQNGRWESEDEGWGRHSYWSARGYVPVAIVAVDMRQDPIAVPRESLTLIARIDASLLPQPHQPPINSSHEQQDVEIVRAQPGPEGVQGVSTPEVHPPAGACPPIQHDDQGGGAVAQDAGT